MANVLKLRMVMFLLHWNEPLVSTQAPRFPPDVQTDLGQYLSNRRVHCVAAQQQKNSGDTCPCETPCNLTRYGKELSMVKIPSKGSARYLSRKYDKSEDYIRYDREPSARLKSLMSSDVVFNIKEHKL